MIARHKREIEWFLKNRPEFGAQLARIRALDDIWTENILVVDDSDMVINVLKAILEDEGRVDSAPDGRAALRKLGDRYYAAIITDVDMPVMDGVEFFKEACRAYPGVGPRFIFFTAITDPRLVQLLSENGGRMKFLPKPGHTGRGGGCPQQTRIARNGEWGLAFEREPSWSSRFISHRMEGSPISDLIFSNRFPVFTRTSILIIIPTSISIIMP